MSKPSCSDCRYECLSWTDYPCSNCCVMVLDGKNMWEPVAPERDVPDIHKRCDNCVHGDMPMSEKPCCDYFFNDKRSSEGRCPNWEENVSQPEPVLPRQCPYNDEVSCYLECKPDGVFRRFNNVDMMDLFQELQTVERNVLLRKGHDYASRGDLGNPFENFDAIAEEVDLTSERVLYIYMAKHLRAIKAYIDYGTLENGESLWGRIIDIRNYLALLAGMAKAKGDI